MATLTSKSRNLPVMQFLETEAAAHGFDLVGVTPARVEGRPEIRLKAFVAQGRHGSMRWLEERIEERANPLELWAEAKSVVMFAMNYGPDADPLANLSRKANAGISVYAQNRDYHQLMKGRLKGIAGRLKRLTGEEVKVFVDTAPVMEKPLAAAAGLGWQGKHTNLVSREFGSWLFLGSIFSAAEIEPSQPETDHCGNCRACLDVCPTNAFPAPYQLDARRCISYLTIEHDGVIAREFRRAMGNRIYGCDDCLAVCPWNKFAEAASEAKLQARDDLRSPELAFLLGLDDPGFREFFSGSAVKRIGREKFIRNVLIAAGNSGERALRNQVAEFIGDKSPTLRSAAVWAYCELSSPQEITKTADSRRGMEKEALVLDEWDFVLGSRGNETK